MAAACFKTRIVSDVVPKYNLYFGSEIWVMRENVRAYNFWCFFIVNTIALYATQFALSVVEGRHTVIYHCME